MTNSLGLLALALLGVPLFAVVALSAIAGYHADGASLQIVVINLYQLTDLPLLESLPLFAFSGYVLARSGAPERLLRFSNALVGWLPGGLAIVAIWACTLVTAITGASGVTIVAMGGLLYPALRGNGYGSRFSLGVVTAGGSLGLLFPPSLPVILYGIVSREPIDDLFLATAVPGVLILLLLSTYAAWRGHREGVPRRPFSPVEVIASLRHAIWEAPLPFFLTIGIYSGYFTVSEAAVIATLYIVLVEVVVYRDVPIGRLGAIARESAVLVGSILVILGFAIAATNWFIDAEVPAEIFAWVQERVDGEVAFLLGLNVFLLVVGCMIDIYAATALIVPLILPVAIDFGIDPIHLGVVFLVNLGIGYSTPPVGLNLFIASVRFRKPVLELYWACLPFIGVLLVALAVVTWWPSVSLFLVRTLSGP